MRLSLSSTSTYERPISPGDLSSPGPNVIASCGVTAAAGDDSQVADRSVRRPLAAILLAGTVIRVALVWSFGGNPPTIDDAKDYNRLAIGLAETGGYIDASGKPTSLRPPLYPLVVAGIYQVFGIENFLAVSAFQAALSLLTALLVYQLGASVYSPRVGLWAAGAACLYPTLLAYNQLLLSEVLFTFFLTAGAVVSVCVLRTTDLRAAILLGLSLGLGALTRSVLWLFAPPLCLALMVFSQAPPRRRLAAGGLALVVFLGTVRRGHGGILKCKRR